MSEAPLTARIAVIVINYKTAALTIEAVQSALESDIAPQQVHVHLIDNASGDADVAALKEAHATRADWANRVSLHLEAVNHGFGRGNNLVLHDLVANLGATAEAPEFAFLLNSDAQIDPLGLATLMSVMKDAPRCAFAGSGISLPDGTPASAAFRFPSAASLFGAAVSFGPISRLFEARKVALPADHPRGVVDWVAGAAVLLRVQALRDVGCFDPEFFLYYEEVDLMHRAQDGGWESWYVPEARVVHYEGASTGVASGAPKRKRRPAYWYDSWRIYFLKHHGRFGAIWAGVMWMLGAVLNGGIARLRGQAPVAPLCFFRDFWRGALRPLIFAGSPPQ